MNLSLLIKYKSKQLSPVNILFCQFIYKDYANSLEKTIGVKQDFTSDIIFFIFMTLLDIYLNKKIDKKL